jgi:hypothetical protein
MIPSSFFCAEASHPCQMITAIYSPTPHQVEYGMATLERKPSLISSSSEILQPEHIGLPVMVCTSGNKLTIDMKSSFSSGAQVHTKPSDQLTLKKQKPECLCDFYEVILGNPAISNKRDPWLSVSRLLRIWLSKYEIPTPSCIH